MPADYRFVHDFFAGVSAGELPDHLFTADMRAWLTTRGDTDKATYQRMIRRLARIFVRPLAFTVDSITAQDDRVVAEVHSEGRLIDGADYAMRYVFVFRIRDGRIASLAEHFNALTVQEQILPLLAGQESGSDPLRT